jgi:arylsulfatase A-like enzyme
MMIRHVFLTILLLAPRAVSAAPPNFLFLLSESLDGRLLREDSPAKIPNIRALLAAGSVRFDTAYSNNPVCAPSRSSLWSGRAPHKIVHEHNGFIVNGVWNNYEGLPSTYNTRLDQLLNASGYATGVFGKTDYTVGGHSESCRLASFTFQVDWPYNVSTGGWNQELLDCVTSSISPGGTGGASGSQYPSDWKIMDTAARFVAEQPEPAFAFAGTSILHPPYATDSFWFAAAAERAIPAVAPLSSAHPCDVQASMKHGCTVPQFNDSARIARVRRVYLAELEEFDAMVGAAVDTLRRAGRLDSTWIILSADHGDMQQEHQLYYKMVPYDASSRVPLVWAHASLGAARVIAQPAQLLDIFPTVLAAANVPVPAYADGHDLAPFLKGASTDPTRPPFVISQNHDEDISMSWFLVANATHKLVQYGTGKEVPPQLFDTATDPDEMVNLAPAHPDDVAALDAQMRTLIDYPSVALDVALYQQQQLRFWVNATGAGWEKEMAAQRWAAAWAQAPERALAAVKTFLNAESVALQPCNGALVN